MCSISVPPLSPAGCLATWCPCIVYSKNRQRLRSLQYQGTPLPDGDETCDDHCFIHGGLTLLGYGWIMQVCCNVDKVRGTSDSAVLRFTHAPKSVSAMGFVEVRLVIASPHGAAARARSRRNAGRSSWRRIVFLEDYALRFIFEAMLLVCTIPSL